MRKLLAIILLTGISALSFRGVDMPVSGKWGAGLAAALRAFGAPAHLGEHDDVTLTLYDPFEGGTVNIEDGTLPDGYMNAGLASCDWWMYDAGRCDSLRRDLANLLPMGREAAYLRGELPPGKVDAAEFDNGLWRKGRGHLGEVETEFYDPPGRLKGRLARGLFYLAVMYPGGMMRPRAYTVFTGHGYPGLTPYAAGLLMEWHRSYPPDDDEQRLNDAMRRSQGNSNPFVDTPELAEYLWGDRAGETYVRDGEPVPLHSEYGLTETVSLVTPSAPAGADWYIDGRRMKSPSVPAKELGEGDHDLEFRAGTVTGRVRIRVRKS